MKKKRQVAKHSVFSFLFWLVAARMLPLVSFRTELHNTLHTFIDIIILILYLS